MSPAISASRAWNIALRTAHVGITGMLLAAAFQDTALKLASAMLFGAVGGALAPSVSCRLQRSSITPSAVTEVLVDSAAGSRRSIRPPTLRARGTHFASRREVAAS